MDLPVILSPFWLSAWFVITLIVAHLAFTYLELLQRSAVRYYVEYIWLGFAFAGLIGAVSESRRIVADNNIDAAENRYEAVLRQGLEKARWTENYFCRQFDFDTWTNNLGRVEDFKTACKWAEAASRRLGKASAASTAGDIWSSSEFLPTNPKIDDTYVQAIIQELIDLSQRIGAHATRLKRLREKSSRGPLEMLLAVGAPWLLAAALSLRIALVTGERQGIFGEGCD